jgi:hypothetical protein
MQRKGKRKSRKFGNLGVLSIYSGAINESIFWLNRSKNISIAVVTVLFFNDGKI